MIRKKKLKAKTTVKRGNGRRNDLEMKAIRSQTQVLLQSPNQTLTLNRRIENVNHPRNDINEARVGREKRSIERNTNVSINQVEKEAGVEMGVVTSDTGLSLRKKLVA